MKVLINGESKEIKDAVTVAEILVIENVEMPDMVSVQLNGEFIDRDNFSETALKANDEIDFLYFMGGGSIGF
jgi:sulfur carrier protein